VRAPLIWALPCVLVVGAACRAEEPEPAPVAGLSPGTIAALDSLGGNSSVPEGVGGMWSPSRRVVGQNAWLGLSMAQAGATVPVPLSDGYALLPTASARLLAVRTNAVLPDSHGPFPWQRLRGQPGSRPVPFPQQLWDIQAGSTFVRQTSDGSSWGFGLSGGSASDKPFHSINEAVVSGLAFYRKSDGDDSAWIFYCVSTTTGQLGRNIPVPGIAYEFKSDLWSGTVGFPFVTLRYKPTDLLEWSFDYAALTDIQSRVSLLPSDGVRLFSGFAWSNQSYLRADRHWRGEMLFYYEKRAEMGLNWTHSGLTLEATGGWAFDRYFVENTGLSLGGRNRVAFGAAPFVGVQFGVKY
jgi:hypothetical protein